ncbi:MAG: sigma-70 family RNA polymerase sigma factor [Verrucomicrobia bacterium]|nr:sigma-70 family RNA polymerase sigma factor [Verrucomicrobiota bacterium]
MKFDPDNAGSKFPRTRWSVVEAALDFRERETAMREFSRLCQAYWYPLYGFARRHGHPPEDAADLTQEFFGLLASGDLLQQADPSKGKLRTLFLTVFSRQLVNARERERAAKRGGNAEIVALDCEGAEGWLASEPIDPRLTPERWFDRQWALTVLECCLNSLGSRLALEGKEQEFTALRPFLSLAGIGTASSEDAARRLGVSADNLRQKLLRLRVRFRVLLEELVAESLAAPSVAAITEEIRCLQHAIRESG